MPTAGSYPLELASRGFCLVIGVVPPTSHRAICPYRATMSAPGRHLREMPCRNFGGMVEVSTPAREIAGVLDPAREVASLRRGNLGE